MGFGMCHLFDINVPTFGQINSITKVLLDKVGICKPKKV